MNPDVGKLKRYLGKYVLIITRDSQGEEIANYGLITEVGTHVTLDPCFQICAVNHMDTYRWEAVLNLGHTHTLGLTRAYQTGSLSLELGECKKVMEFDITDMPIHENAIPLIELAQRLKKEKKTK